MDHLHYESLMRREIIITKCEIKIEEVIFVTEIFHTNKNSMNFEGSESK